MGSSGKSILFLLPTEADYVKCLNEKNIRLVEITIFTESAQTQNQVPVVQSILSLTSSF